MGILSRAGEIIASNINALLDKCEDPSKMVDQYLRQAMSDFAECKQDTAKVMAEEKAAKRNLDEAQAKVDEFANAAKNAVLAGNDEDAKALLAKKAAAEQTRDTALNIYRTAKGNADKMRQLYNKLKSDIATLEARRQNVKAQISVAKTQEDVNKLAKGFGTGSKGAEGFARMERVAQERMDAAEAEAELNSLDQDPDEAELLAKYTSGGASVDDELAKLKAELGKQ